MILISTSVYITLVIYYICFDIRLFCIYVLIVYDFHFDTGSGEIDHSFGYEMKRYMCFVSISHWFLYSNIALVVYAIRFDTVSCLHTPESWVQYCAERPKASDQRCLGDFLCEMPCLQRFFMINAFLCDF